MSAKCIIPNCNAEVVCRGMCACCYKQAWEAVKSGKTTWTALEAMGLSLPANRPKGAFAQALARVLPDDTPAPRVP